jgi:uncharacterized protein (DUF433 family)
MIVKDLLGKIIVDPKIMAGKPVIKGTRITIQQILGLLTEGTNIEEILSEFPHILREDVYACLLFAQQTKRDN